MQQGPAGDVYMSMDPSIGLVATVSLVCVRSHEYRHQEPLRTVYGDTAVCVKDTYFR